MAFPEALEFGAEWSETKAVAILYHGHEQGVDGMKAIATSFDCPGMRYILPRSEDGIWFPKSFLEPVEENEPQLSQSLAHYKAVLDSVLAKGIAQDRIVLGGFAEGAALTSEYLVRNPRSYGAAFIFTCGLMDQTAIGRRPGSGLLAVPVYVTASESDEQLPIQRVRDTIRTLQAGGALITSHIFADRPRIICNEEIVQASKILRQVRDAE